MTDKTELEKLLSQTPNGGVYNLIHPYPRGRTGEAWQAQKRTGETSIPVVIKLPAIGDSPPEKIQQGTEIQREIETLRDLHAGGKNNSIIKLIDNGTFRYLGAEYPFLVMESVPGFPIEDILRSTYKDDDFAGLPSLELLEIFELIIKTLRYVHEKGYIYNDVDIKHIFWNRNHLLKPEQRLRIIDWGNAVRQDDELKAKAKGITIASDLQQSGQLLKDLFTVSGMLSSSDYIPEDIRQLIDNIQRGNYADMDAVLKALREPIENRERDIQNQIREIQHRFDRLRPLPSDYDRLNSFDSDGFWLEFKEDFLYSVQHLRSVRHECHLYLVKLQEDIVKRVVLQLVLFGLFKINPYDELIAKIRGQAQETPSFTDENNSYNHQKYKDRLLLSVPPEYRNFLDFSDSFRNCSTLFLSKNNKDIYIFLYEQVINTQIAEWQINAPSDISRSIQEKLRLISEISFQGRINLILPLYLLAYHFGVSLDTSLDIALASLFVHQTEKGLEKASCTLIDSFHHTEIERRIAEFEDRIELFKENPAQSLSVVYENLAQLYHDPSVYKLASGIAADLKKAENLEYTSDDIALRDPWHQPIILQHLNTLENMRIKWDNLKRESPDTITAFFDWLDRYKAFLDEWQPFSETARSYQSSITNIKKELPSLIQNAADLKVRAARDNVEAITSNLSALRLDVTRGWFYRELDSPLNSLSQRGGIPVNPLVLLRDIARPLYEHLYSETPELRQGQDVQ